MSGVRLIQISQAKRRKLERLQPLIEEAVRTSCRSGFEGGLDDKEQEWMANELLIAWNELDLLSLFEHRDRIRLERIARRLERAL
jgi:hypothetical protein